jgi:NADH-quinone oxidoreductase subunit M
MGILSLLLWTPAFGVLLLVFVPGHKTLIIRHLARGIAALAFIISCVLLYRFNQQTGSVQFGEYFPLNPNLGSAYALGVDGISMPMLVLASLLTLISLIPSFTIPGSVKGYHICILLIEFGINGVFLAGDWALFYIFWEMSLIPLFFLIGRWGGKKRHTASLNFAVYTMGGSVFMLISLLAISQYGLKHTGSLMTSMTQAAQGMPLSSQVLVLLGFLLGFGVKMPIFPLHAWLPLAQMEAPAPVNILLSGVLLKMGGYGLIRAVIMLPEAVQVLQPVLVFLAFFGMLYGSLLAWRQSEFRRMLAYSSISNMSAVLLGMVMLTEVGMAGSVLLMIAHGLIVASLFLLVALLNERKISGKIQGFRAMVQTSPRFVFCFTISLFALMGLPGTLGFIAQLHLLIAGFEQWHYLMVFYGLTMLITAAYVIRIISLLFSGTVTLQTENNNDLSTRDETLATGLLVALILFFGFVPAALIEVSQSSVTLMQNLIKLRIL